MGKTVGAIITIGAAIAVNVIPGIGQAISGAIVAGSFGAITTGAIVSGLIVSAITVAGLTALGGLLGPSVPKPDTAVSSIKNPRPPRVSGYGLSRLYFAQILYETDTAGRAIDVGAVHDGNMHELVQLYLNDDPVTLAGNVVNEGDDERYGNNISLYWTDGSTPGTPFPAVIAALPGVWTSDHRGDGVVLLAQICRPVKSKSFLKRFPNGVPMPSMAARWQLCPDPDAEDPSNPAGWTWTENPVRHLMHYKMVREGADYATKIAPTLGYWKAAADICDEAISLKAGGSEARYRSAVAHKHTDRHAEVTATLLSTFDGWIAPRSDGALIVYAGKYYTPTVSIGPDEIVAYEWNGVGVDDDQAVNELICSYISADHDYATVEADAWRDETDISDRGQILSATLDPQVPSWGQVRRLAKRKMARANAIHRGTITTNIAGRIARGHRYINLLIEEAGTVFYDGPAEITALTRNLSSGGVTFTWVAADPNIDAWNPATEEGEPAAKGDRIAPQPLAAPTIDTATIVYSEDSGGDAIARIVITGEGPDREDLTWYARWRVQGASVWGADAEYSDVAAGPAVELHTDFVPTDATVEVQIAYQVGDGRVSPWSEPEPVDTAISRIIGEDGDGILTEDGDNMGGE